MRTTALLLTFIAIIACTFTSPVVYGAGDEHTTHTAATSDHHNTTTATAAEYGDDHGSHAKASVIPTAGEAIVPLVTSLLVFLIVLAVFSKLVWPKISSGLADRENKIRQEIAAAELAQRQAKSALEQYEQNLAEARAEAQKMLDEAKAKQQVLAAELRAKADAELSQLRERAMKDIDAAKKAAVSELYTEAATLATSIAERILEREISADDQQRLVNESLAQFQSTAAAT